MDKEQKSLDQVNCSKVDAEKPLVVHFDFVSYRPFHKTLELRSREKGNFLSRKHYWLNILMYK